MTDDLRVLPWLGVRMPDGTQRDVGLTEVFELAHEARSPRH